MVSEFAQFTLDELSQDPLIFKGIERRVKHQLLATFDVFGIVIQAVQVAAHNVPEQVVAQRLAVWRSPWQSRLRILTAAGNEEALKQFKLARANAQIEIIEKIMASIDEMRHVEDANLSDIVAIRAVDVLENASAKSAAQLMLPSHIFNSLPGQGPQQETGTAENSSAEQNRE
jgi:hypothetical protein